MDTVHLADVFIVPRSFGPHQSGPVRFGMLASFSIYMVQTTTCGQFWATTSSDSRFSAWSHISGSSCSPKSTKGCKLFITFPEDLGGHPEEGSSSIWVLREFRLLLGVNEACRGAGFVCQLGQADFKRPAQKEYSIKIHKNFKISFKFFFKKLKNVFQKKKNKI